MSAFPGSAEVERLMRPASTTFEPITDHVYDPQGPIGTLVGMLGLRPTEADLLAVLLAYETDPASAKLAAYLGGTSTALTIDTLFEIAYRPRCSSVHEASMLLHQDLAPDHAARRLRFVIVDGAESRSFLAQTIRLHPRFTSWMLGQRALTSELAAHARLVPPAPPVDTLDVAKIDLAARALQEPGSLLWLRGVHGAGRELLVRAVAFRQGRSLLVVNGRSLEPDLITATFREATLQNTLVAIRDAGEAIAGDRLVRMRECLAAFRGSVAMLGTSSPPPAISSLRPTTELEVPIPPHAERLALWRAHLGTEHSFTDAHWREVSGLYNLGCGGIVEACANAHAIAKREKTTTSRMHVARAVRGLFDEDLTAVARRVEISQTWDDVVLPEEIMDGLNGLRDRVAFRNEVLGEWGFARKVGKGLGITALFSGQPGTGKSMVAGLIANELSLDLYVVDLSRIMSKWLGETEKNLARAFDAAEAGHVLLLFDEADTVLGKRNSKMQSANDRHANLETNFILSRLEQFQGIAMFTTNIPAAIDDAVMRRMSAHIAFPFPDAEARAELWQRMIPAETPVAKDVDFMRLARDFELTGGYIRNIVLRAAYLARREGKPLARSHLERAAHGEYGDRGSLSVGGKLT
ncbi:MAG: ATP-binding protein [Kofleriaceae bacterium]|nr:ATP-binding protein [Kofleriaceae bacterium]